MWTVLPFGLESRARGPPPEGKIPQQKACASDPHQFRADRAGRHGEVGGRIHPQIHSQDDRMPSFDLHDMMPTDGQETQRRESARQKAIDASPKRITLTMRSNSR